MGRNQDCGRREKANPQLIRTTSFELGGNGIRSLLRKLLSDGTPSEGEEGGGEKGKGGEGGRGRDNDRTRFRPMAVRFEHLSLSMFPEKKGKGKDRKKKRWRLIGAVLRASLSDPSTKTSVAEVIVGGILHGGRKVSGSTAGFRHDGRSGRIGPESTQKNARLPPP